MMVIGSGRGGGMDGDVDFVLTRQGARGCGSAIDVGGFST